MKYPKHLYIRSPALLRAARDIPCQNCGADDGTVCAAHTNWQGGKGRGIKRVQEFMEIWQRGEKQRAETHARRHRIEALLRERVKPLAIAHEVGVTEERVRQIRKEMGL